MLFRLPVLTALFALSLTAAPSFADSPCEFKDGVEFDVMSTTKVAFAKLNSGLMHPLFVDGVKKAAVDVLFSQVRAAAPNGFDSCQTFVQRLDTGGMVQEVTSFVTSDGGTQIFVYALGMPNEAGDIRLHKVNFNTDIDEVLSLLR